jgi:nicotinamide-nucleotide amidase
LPVSREDYPELVEDWLAAWRADPTDCACRIAVGFEVLGNAGIQRLAELTGLALRTRGWRVATAESCTGGGLGAALTAIAGSSAWVNGGCITYSNAAKTQLLDVPAVLIEQFGAVSQPVVEAMALGACQRLGSDAAVAISGVAGPGGGSPDKPVGTVWLAWAAPGPPQHRVRSAGLWFPGDRAAVRLGAVCVGLLGLLDRSSGEEPVQRSQADAGRTN